MPGVLLRAGDSLGARLAALMQGGRVDACRGEVLGAGEAYVRSVLGRYRVRVWEGRVAGLLLHVCLSVCLVVRRRRC